MNDYARDLFSLSTYLGYFQTIISKYSAKSAGMKVVFFPLFLLCLLFLIVAITPVVLVGLFVKLFFDILIDDLVDRGSGFAMLAYMIFIEFFFLMFLILGIEFVLYGILKLMCLGLGKTIYEAKVEDVVKYNNVKKEEKEETSNIYVIEDEDYK